MEGIIIDINFALKLPFNFKLSKPKPANKDTPKQKSTRDLCADAALKPRNPLFHKRIDIGVGNARSKETRTIIRLNNTCQFFWIILIENTASVKPIIPTNPVLEV